MQVPRNATGDLAQGVTNVVGGVGAVARVVDVDGTMGTVEEIGLRTTRIRDFDGRTITVPNSVIANAEVKNVTSEATRRVDTYIGLTYDTTAAEMQRALTLSAETVADVNGVDAEDAGAWFWEYGDRAMQIRLTYHVEDLDRWKAVRNDVNTSLQVAFEEAGLDLAVPVGTLRLDEQTA
jgi:MscS family membrane protein